MGFGRIALVLALALPNVTFSPLRPASSAPPRFVARRGQQLVRSGRPFRFVGVNCCRLAEYAQQSDSILATLAARGVKVVRFWAFRSFCGPNGDDYSRFDVLVAAAKQHDILLLPVLENHWRHFTPDTSEKSPAWYGSGWKGSYREHIRAVALHFRDEPQILAWQLVNEPEIYPDTDANFALLQQFAREAAREIKQMDPHHLVSLGLLGIGQPSTTGKRFRALQNFSGIDVVTAHDYGYIYEPLAGREWPQRENNFYADLCDARSLVKPFIATESGIALEWVKNDRAQRAELFRAKLSAFFAAGGSGYLLWNYEPLPDTSFGFDATDPVMKVLAETARRL